MKIRKNLLQNRLAGQAKVDNIIHFHELIS